MEGLELENISKSFHKHTEKPIYTTLKSYFLKDYWKKKNQDKERFIWALKNINIKVGKGKTFGIVGRNGSGKSTLLKIICRILKPDSGQITLNGSVAALIELGAGFHPELTGRENVMINGIILGLTKNKIKQCLEKIVDFAELNEFIDDPIRTYSSGMVMRLAFSVAIHVDPEILIIDEVLAVGDESFQKKCKKQIELFKKKGKTILLVSHALSLVEELCDEVAILEKGCLVYSGRTDEAIAYYKRMISMIEAKELNIGQKILPERLLVSCVAENNEIFKLNTLCLFKTLYLNGGDLKKSTKIAFFVDSADADIVEELTKLGVIVKIVKKLDVRCPHANKVQMLDEKEDYDVMVALDCDTLVLKDFIPIIDPNVVMAKVVDDDPLSLQQWTQLFDRFELKLPKDRFITSFGVKMTIPYFNSGVIIIPKKYVFNLRETWKKYIKNILNNYECLPEISPFRFFSDQFALALTIVSEEIPIIPLPLEMNFPIHENIHPFFEPDKIDPFIVHHHGVIFDSKGFNCKYEKLNKKIEILKDQINIPVKNNLKRDSKFNQENFDNKKFWEERYSSNIELGSGIGSRGESLIYKRELLREILKVVSPKSVLDIGCGELEVIKDLPIENYFGIDISGFIINRNRKIKPNWEFRSGDFLEIFEKEDLKSDLVLCFDVIIHEHDHLRYKKLVSALVNSTLNLGFITGYQLPPRDNFRSKITSYHEPIIESLKIAGARDISLIGFYRDTSVISFHPPGN